MAKMGIYEAVELNDRTDYGLITVENVITDEKKDLVVKKTGKFYYCCNRAFLTEVAYAKHQDDQHKKVEPAKEVRRSKRLVAKEVKNAAAEKKRALRNYKGKSGS